MSLQHQMIQMMVVIVMSSEVTKKQTQMMGMWKSTAILKMNREIGSFQKLQCHEKFFKNQS